MLGVPAVAAGLLGAWWPLSRCAGHRAGRGLSGPARTDAITDYQPKLPLRVYSADGVLMGEFGDERRHFTPIARSPRSCERRSGHRGCPLLPAQRRGLPGRSAGRLAQFGAAGSQGASTITMQVARNFYLSTEKTLTRKLYEVLLALKIESQLSKDQILEIYMNQIYLGQRAHGFAAASEIYFGKPLQDITVAEAAMLAGLPKAPSAYNPIANPSAPPSGSATSSTACWKTASSPPSSGEPPWRRSWCTGAQRLPVHGEYVAELARQMIFAEYGPDTYTRGLQVH
jgi:penicillin-binding protein 1A